MISNNSGNLITWLLMLGIVLMGSNSLLLSPIMLDVSRDLSVEPVKIARVISAFGAATALSSFFLSRYINTLGTRTVLIVGSLVMAGGLLACSLSSQLGILLAAQSIIGIVVGMMIPAIYSATTLLAPKGEEAKTVGRVISGWGISLVLGVPFSAVITDLYHWRAAFAILAIIALFIAVGYFSCLRLGPSGGTNVSPSPIKALQLDGVRPLLFICFLFMVAFYGAYAFLGIHLRTSLSISATQTGLVVLAYGSGFGLGGFAMSRIDRLGPARFLTPALLVIAAIYLALIPMTTDLVGSISIAILWGFGNHIGMNLVILFLSQKSLQARSTIMGLQTTTTYSAVFLGPLLFGALYASQGFGSIAALAAILLVFGATVSWRKRFLFE